MKRYQGRIMITSLLFVFNGASFINGYHHFDAMDYLINFFSFFVGYAVGHKYDRAIYLSQRDELTGIYNRRSFIQLFEKLSFFAQRTENKLVLLVIDCDNFKKINDTYGHTTGDLALKLIAKVLRESTRNSDVVARWGGDEFVLLGHHKSILGVRTLMNRIHEGIHEVSTQHKIPLSVSIGYSIFPDDCTDLTELMRHADNHMYETKGNKKEELALSY